MTIQVHAPFPVYEHLQGLIDEKVGKLETYFDRIHAAEVFFKEEENRSFQSPNGKVVEIKIEVPGQVLYADDNTDHFEKSLAGAAEKIRRQLKKYKENLLHH